MVNILGLYVTIQNTDGTYASQSTVIFAQKSMRHKRRLQPIVSIYTKQKSHSNSPEHEGFLLQFLCLSK